MTWLTTQVQADLWNLISVAIDWWALKFCLFDSPLHNTGYWQKPRNEMPMINFIHYVHRKKLRDKKFNITGSSLTIPIRKWSPPLSSSAIISQLLWDNLCFLLNLTSSTKTISRLTSEGAVGLAFLCDISVSHIRNLLFFFTWRMSALWHKSSSRHSSRVSRV